MKTYSKPSKDIQLEADVIASNDKVLLQEQSRFSEALKAFPLRQCCLLCKTPVATPSTFVHRGIEYLSCEVCSHVQTKAYVPNDFPQTHEPDAIDYAKIYGQPDEAAYLSRVERVYEPKRKWIFDSITGRGDLRDKKWVELGCGAGYFLKSLQQAGVKRFTGYEQNQALVSQGSYFVDQIKQQPFDSNLIKSLDVDVLVAFFVLEHVQNAFDFWQSLAQLKSGTLFVFSVPTFSFSTVLESAFDNYAARNLDNGLHTQLYTDNSIDYALSLAGFDKLATWYFGQDASDLVRLLLGKLQGKYHKNLLKQHQSKLNSLVDSLQQAIDQNQFCDARHIIGVKE